MIASTGSPLAPESFDYVYDAIKPDVHLASISGGTDIVSCFVLGDADEPVWRGEIQGAGPRHGGRCLRRRRPAGARGEGRAGLHQGRSRRCRSASGTIPTAAKYRAAYFERFPGVWCHGDFAEWTEHGGMIIHGRSDATLNPGGVRIGTAEIYAQVEQIPEVAGGARHRPGLGQRRARRAVRAARARASRSTTRCATAIRTKIRAGATPRHVPAKIVAVADIPRTKSGKITELAVRDVVHGRAVKNTEALANPEALELYRDLPSFASERGGGSD